MMAMLRRLLGRDEPPTLVAQMRDLWRVPADYTQPTTARIVPTKKPATIADWKRRYDEQRRSA